MIKYNSDAAIAFSLYDFCDRTASNMVRLGFFDENYKSQRRDKSPSLQ
ncbi:hypothetical protein [Nostoc sp.]